MVATYAVSLFPSFLLHLLM